MTACKTRKTSNDHLRPGYSGRSSPGHSRRRNTRTRGGYGRKELGSPVEYDRLTFVLPDRNVQIEFFNRGITLFMTDDERFRRIHRILGRLDLALQAKPGSAVESH